MLYFSTAPVRLDSIDEQQYRALKQFRASCESRGLIETFESLPDLQEKFGRQLIQQVLSRWAAAGNDADEETEEVRWRWQSGIAEHAPVLSEDAKDLLREGAGDNQGSVMWLRTMGGTRIQTRGRQFVETPGDPRCEARWESALRELVDEGLVQDRGYKGEVFGVTHKGYTAAEAL